MIPATMLAAIPAGPGVSAIAQVALALVLPWAWIAAIDRRLRRTR